MVLRRQVPADDDHGDPVIFRLVPDALPFLRITKLQVPVRISGNEEHILGRLGQQANCLPGGAAFRSHSSGSASW